MSWVLGALLSAVSCFVANFGLLLQKQAIIRDAQSSDSKPTYWRNPRWIAGFFTFIGGQVISVFALSLTPQSILGALSGCSLLSNSILAPLMLGEECTVLHTLSTLMIAIGVCAVFCFAAPLSNSALTMDAIMDLLIRPQAIAIFAGSLAIIFSLFMRGHFAVKRPGSKTTSPADPFTFAITSAILGAFSVTMSKGVVTVLATEYRMNSTVIYDYRLLAMSLFGISCAVLSVYALNLGIEYFNALLIIPMYYSLALLFQSGFGGIIYDEFSNFDTFHAVGFIIGVLINVLGVWILSIANASEVDVPACSRSSQHIPLWHSDTDDESGDNLIRKKSLKNIFTQSFSVDQSPCDSQECGMETRQMTSLRALDAVDEVVGQFADGGARLWVLHDERHISPFALPSVPSAHEKLIS